jgi:hypothetical protein
MREQVEYWEVTYLYVDRGMPKTARYKYTSKQDALIRAAEEVMGDHSNIPIEQKDIKVTKHTVMVEVIE